MQDADDNVDKTVQTVDEKELVFLDIDHGFDAVWIYDRNAYDTNITLDLFEYIAIGFPTLNAEMRYRSSDRASGEASYSTEEALGKSVLVPQQVHDRLLSQDLLLEFGATWVSGISIEIPT